MSEYQETLTTIFDSPTVVELILVSIILSAFALVLIRILLMLLHHGLKQDLSRLVIDEVKRIPFIVYFFFTILIVFERSNFNTDDILFSISFVVMYLIVAYYLLRFISRSITHYTETVILSKKSKSARNYYLYLSLIGRILIWIFGFIFTLSNLGVDVTAFITALGISGFAFAFAFRNLIKDVLGSFLIIFDEIVKVGDYISVDKCSGIVRHIGIKSTRIQTDEGEEVIIPNSSIVDKAVLNYKARRRIPINVTITISDYKKKKLPEISKLLTETITKEFPSIRSDSLKIIMQELSEEEVKINCFLVIMKVKGIDETVRDRVMQVIFKEFKLNKVGSITLTSQ